MNASSPRIAIADPPAETATTAEKLTWAVNFAVLAPSKHNTQPWYFEVGHDAVDIHADGSRALPASDPYGREMLIGCGAAIANLCLGVRALGYLPDVRVFPQGAYFSHLARVRIGEPAEPTVDERELIDAVPRRHTQRLPLDAGVVPESLVVALEEAARREGARLTFVTTRRHERAVAELIERAEATERGDPRREAELREWVRPRGATARDGIPIENAGMGARGAEMRFATRDFDVDKQAEVVGDPATDRPMLALLWTHGDEPADWVTAGRALQTILLRACADDVHASFVNQPVEAPDTRALLAEELDVPGSPQMLLRMGWGVGALCTPRRPVSEILDVTDPVLAGGAS